MGQGDASLLVRTNGALFKVGSEVTIDLLAAGAVSDGYLDITRDNQTLAVSTVRLEEGRGSHRLTLDSTMAGTLAISAYVLGERGEYVRDSRAIFVAQAGELRVTTALDREEYQPGGKARVEFQVQRQGQPIQAALGIQVVDEAVFALSESRPGLLRLFFALEEELLKPSYQIGRGIGATLGSLILRSDSAGEEEQRAV